MSILREFKEFAVKGSAIELAVGVIIGAAFGQIVNSIVNDLFNPIMSVVVGRVDFTDIVIGLPGESYLRVGSFLNAVINFLVVSFSVFFMVKQVNRFRRKPDNVPNTKECQFCAQAIPLKASRCPHCTSQLV